MDITIKRNNRYRSLFIILTIISFIMLSTTIFINGAIKRYYSDIYKSDLIALPVDVYLDDNLVLENLSQISKIDIKNVASVKIKTKIPDDIQSHFDCLLLKTICGSTKVYLDDNKIFSFPNDEGFFDINSRYAFIIKNNNLKGNVLSVELNTKNFLLMDKLNIYPIYITSEYGIISTLKNSLFWLLILTSFDFIIIITTIISKIVSRIIKSQRLMTAFIIIAIINLFYTLSIFTSNITIFGNQIFWVVLSNTSRYAFFIAYLYILLKISDQIIISSKSFTAIYIISFAIFIAHFYFSFSLSYYAYIVRVVSMIFKTIFLSLIVIKSFRYTFNKEKMIYLTYSVVFLYLSEILSFSLDYLFFPSIWQNIFTSILRVLALLLIIVPEGLNFYKSQLSILKNKKIDMYMNIDILSGCLNRRKYEDYIKCESNYLGRQMSVIFADINSLKRINDYFGHGEGDKLISYCGKCLRLFSPQESKVFRIGGDEFFIIYPTDRNQSISEIIKNLKEKFRESSPYCSTISIGGISVKPQSYEDLLNAIHKADELMYRDKINKDNYSLLVNARMVSDEY